MTPVTDAAMRNCLLAMVQARGPQKTICPSEVARALGGTNWRGLMDQVRAVGMELVHAKKIVITQKGQVVHPQTAKGPIRYRLIPSPPTDQ